MPHIRVQKLSTLLFPMLIVALLAGAAMGALGGTLLVLPDIIASSGDPDLIASSTDPDAFNGWAGAVGYFLIPIVYGTVCGTFLALIPCTGSYAALAIQDKRHPASSGSTQAMAAGVGAAVAGVLPAMFVVWVIGEWTLAGLAIGAVLVVLCFAFAQLALRGILLHVEKRGAVLRKAI